MCSKVLLYRIVHFVQKNYILPIVTVGFATGILLMSYDSGYFNNKVAKPPAKLKLREELSSIELKILQQTTEKISSLITTTTKQTTTTQIPWYDPTRLLKDTEKQFAGWKAPKGKIEKYIRKIKLSSTVPPITTVNLGQVFTITDRWKVQHIGCFRKARFAILTSPNVTTNFHGDIGDCLERCGKLYKDWVAYDGTGKRCSCGISLYKSMPIMLMTDHSITCGAGFEDVYRIVKFSPNAFITMDTIKQSGIGCFPRQEKMNEIFGSYMDSALTIGECLLQCETNAYPSAAWTNPGICQCGQFDESTFPGNRLTLREMGPSVNDALCDEAECHGGAPCEYVRIMRTNAEDKRCDVRNFLPPTVGRLVSLMSFPGSGNTWVRYLIEEATGIFTGSVYSDVDLYQHGFIGEILPWNSRRTSVIKTHYIVPKEATKFDEAILIIRSPYDAIMAEFNRFRGGHTGYAEEALFKTPEWIYFISYKMPKWFKSIELYAQMEKVQVIYFEDIVKDPITEVRKIVNFLNYPINNIEERLICLESNLSGNFKRPKRTLSFDPYPQKSKDIVNYFIKTAREILAKRNLPTLPLYEK
ncbi:sialate:O-sulfotransferase 1-like isoform X1 [Styela clava]